VKNRCRAGRRMSVRYLARMPIEASSSFKLSMRSCNTEEGPASTPLLSAPATVHYPALRRPAAM